MNYYNTKELIKKINDNLKVKNNGERVNSISNKDEKLFMRSMINDKNYLPERRNNKGESFCATPYQDMRDLTVDIISKTTKISSKEAEELVQDYEFTNANADKLINLSKDFTIGYLETGRKLNIGSGEDYNISIALKNIKERDVRCPKKNEKGEQVLVKSPAHKSLKVWGSNPTWNK